MSVEIKEPIIEKRNITELKNWDDNPRSILDEDFDRLINQIKKFGIYKPLLINQDNIVLGGNMRLRAFNKLGVKEVVCTVVNTSNESEMLEYALSDNDQVGTTDDLKLAELATLHPIETKLFKVQSNYLRPIESILNPTDPTAVVGADEDMSTLDADLDTYLNGNIKQIVLYYDNDEYEEIVRLLEEIGKSLELENNTDIINHLIREYHEKSIPKTE